MLNRPLGILAWYLVSAFCLAATTTAKDATPPLPEASSALSDYVKQPDASYAWHVRQRGKVGGGEYVELILTSQTWRNIAWKHQLFIYHPAKARKNAQALLLIDGGSWSDSLEKAADESNPTPLPDRAAQLVMLADLMQSPIAVIRQVPHQPMFNGRKEDQIIALTFAKYLETGETDWPLLLPMVKAAVRAMDTVQAFAKQEWQLDVEKFLVTGASKRGWTTWLTAATDPRVDALAPMVINMLNMVAHDQLQRNSFGSHSEQIHDYTELGLLDKLVTPQGAELRSIVDPIAYRTQLKQPKLIILATNDAYWPVDALNLYWNELKGDKYILYVPNNGHGIHDYTRVAATILALQQSLEGGKPMPKLAWQLDDDAAPHRLSLTSAARPLAVRRWTAHADSRDFRKATWRASSLPANGNEGRSYETKLDQPQQGYEACFLEAEFPGETIPFTLSTTLHVLGNSTKAATANAPKDD
ncbi:MAG: PhoPQ-activated pathogenicity protein [Pirellulales bacterium]|nr:PhoPQ-activated pathogenicity protein [Pirellulales bacterium]